MEFTEISDEMIGMDEKICNCASVVIDMILSEIGDDRNENPLL